MLLLCLPLICFISYNVKEGADDMDLEWRPFNKTLFAKMRRASRDYGLITEGDHICIALSGGKDSTLLLYAMEILRRTLPCNFQLSALSVDLGWQNDYLAHIAFCKKLGIPYDIVKTDIGPIIFNERKEKNPCSLCARMRRGAVNNWAVEHGCNKVALGHHLDDVIETLLMSLFYEGRLHTFAPYAYLSRTDITVIRPLVYVLESDIQRIAKRLNLPILLNACPADGKTTRSAEKKLISELAQQNPPVRERMMHAIETSLWTEYRIKTGDYKEVINARTD